MSSIRSSSRSMVMRPSARASGAPGHVWAPWPNARCWRALARSTSKSVGWSKRPGSRFAAPLTTMRVVPAGIVDAAELRRHAREPEVAFHRALDAQALLDEVRDVLTVFAQQLLELVVVADALQRRAEEAHRRLLTGCEEVGGDARDVDRLGDRAVGERRGRHAGQHVVARLAPAVLDVRGELFVEELERVVRERLVAGAAHGAGLLARTRHRAARGTARGRAPVRRAGRRRRAWRTAGRTRR